MSLKILIADDSPIYAGELKQFLANRLGTKSITIVFDGYQAIDEIIKNDYDAVILAMFMPGLDGLGVLGNIKKLAIDNAPAFFVISTSGNKKIIISAFELGADFFMVRPIDFEQLALRIEQFMPQSVPETKQSYVFAASPHEITTDDRIKIFWTVWVFSKICWDISICCVLLACSARTLIL